MPTQETGLPKNVATGFPALQSIIQSSTNTTPITLVTSSPHGLSLGDPFRIGNHLANETANGTWIAGPGSTSTSLVLLNFDGTNSVGIAAGGATGQIQSLRMLPMTLFSDGDAFSAANLNVSPEALADRTAWLYAATAPKYKCIDIQRVTHTDSSVSLTTNWATITPGSPGVYIIGPAAAQWIVGGGFYTIQGGIGGTGPNAGDIIEVEFDTTVATDGSATWYALSLQWNVALPATTPSQDIPGARKGIPASTVKTPLHIGGIIVGGVDAFLSGQLSLALYGAVGATVGGENIQLYGDYVLTTKLWRPTGAPQ